MEDSNLRVPVLDGRRCRPGIGGHQIRNRAHLLPLPLVLGRLDLGCSHLHRRELDQTMSGQYCLGSTRNLRPSPSLPVGAGHAL
jgi:hypothetical protein